MKLTQTHLRFWQAHQVTPLWTQKLNGDKTKPQGEHLVNIDMCINAHSGIRPTSQELTAQNLLSLVKSAIRRGENIHSYLVALSINPGTVIQPQARKRFAREWAKRIQHERIQKAWL